MFLDFLEQTVFSLKFGDGGEKQKMFAPGPDQNKEPAHMQHP